MAFLFPALLPKCIIHCPMATISPQLVATWDLEIKKAIVKEFWETLQKFRTFKEQEQRRAHEGTELQNILIQAFIKATTHESPTAEWVSQCISNDVFSQIQSQLWCLQFSEYQVWVIGTNVIAPVYLGTLGFVVLAQVHLGQLLPLFASRSFKGLFCASDSWKALSSTVNHLTGA